MSNDTELLHASVIKRIWKKCKEEDMDIVAFAWRIQREAERAARPSAPTAGEMHEQKCPHCGAKAATLFSRALDGDELETVHCGCLHSYATPQPASSATLGDALRLAVKLGIEIHPDIEVREVYTAFSVHRPNLVGLNTWAPMGDDPYAATRRAIVRAAAEIGKAQ